MARLKAPTPSAMRSAAEWLDTYETTDGDEMAIDCHATAQWLREQATAVELRVAARAYGITVAMVRKALEVKHNQEA